MLKLNEFVLETILLNVEIVEKANKFFELKQIEYLLYSQSVVKVSLL